MISDKETILDDGIESYERHAYDRIYALEYGLKELLETVISEISEIPKSEVYIAVRELTGRSFLFRKRNDGLVDKLEFFIDNISVFQNNEVVRRDISGMLNIKEEELFIQPLYIKSKKSDYQVYLIIYTEDYTKYIGLSYFYESFAFDSDETLSLKKYSPVVACDELVANTVKFIYSKCINYHDKKVIPQFSMITKLSAMTYENNNCNARIICTHEAQSLDIELVNPVILDVRNLRAIRKLLEIANDEFALIVRWRTIDGDVFPLFEVLGFAKIEKYQKCSQFVILGYLHWSFFDERKPILNYCKGRYIVSKESEIDEKYLRQCLRCIFGSNTEYDSVLKIVNEAWKQPHGTTLIITNNALNEAFRLCNKNRGYKIKEIDLDLQCNLVNNISTIDGAIMIDQFGKCFGIGVILDGECIVKGNQSRGARFNSAYNYIAIMKENNKEAIAVVMSEDRTIDIITTQDIFNVVK